ncbi:MAG: hypothetical protein KKC30_05740 [Proteobacteria bacterium]|nr:hypothetical protein [Pseudomonadota bacterium]MBU4384337.1 hypothetical protein [Pseudomonadota bacterium]MBU4606325.1 hypothetical protein [Pseudomonadota bacterium]MCG2764155.1 BREX-1 system adenine-specific DNA-methyltransferase PglX [Desulfarculaceae bacterium]
MTIEQLLQKINDQADKYAGKGRDPNLPENKRDMYSDMADELLALHQRLFKLSISKHDKEIAVLAQCIKNAGTEANALNKQITDLTKKIAELRGYVAEGNEILSNVLDKVEAVEGLLSD